MDCAVLQKRVRRFTRDPNQTLAKSLTDLDVALYAGRGICEGPDVMRVEGAESTLSLKAKYIVLACGSRSAAFPGVAPERDAVLDSTVLLNIEAVPESLIIIGGGVIGLKMGDFFAAMGSTVTVVEAAPQPAPTEDVDITLELQKILAQNGRTCLVGTKVSSLATRDGRATLILGGRPGTDGCQSPCGRGPHPEHHRAACRSGGLRPGQTGGS